MQYLNMSTELSVEQILQCAHRTYGCNGAEISYAYYYLSNNNTKGLVSAADYPYTSYDGTNGTCNVDDSKAVVGINYFFSVAYVYHEPTVASYVQSMGPVAVTVDASNWNTYTGGVMTVCGRSVNFDAQAVGVDASPDGYWKVRNSWGTSWGEAGFIRLAYGHNTCNIAYASTNVGGIYKV